MTAPERLLQRPFFIKLLNWEYWSFNTVYIPISIVWLFLCARARSFFFFSASNPSIPYGGFLMESKKLIYDILPEGSYPKTALFKTGGDISVLLAKLEEEKFRYPLIGKPDIGARGMGVKKLNNPEELIGYAQIMNLDFLIQEFVPFEKEIGIFYYRYPGQEKGKISGIVLKEFLQVMGDGVSSLRTLCKKENRFILQLKKLEKLYGEQLNEVLPEGVVKILVPYGNHSRGAKFLDGSALADEKLHALMDNYCRQINGLYYGRLDIRYHDWEELKEGKNFSVIEVNGAGAEPTHMYDPSHGVFFAWKEIIRHWVILWRISRINHKNGIPYLSYKEGVQMFRDNKMIEQKLTEQDV